MAKHLLLSSHSDGPVDLELGSVYVYTVWTLCIGATIYWKMGKFNFLLMEDIMFYRVKYYSQANQAL